MERCKFDPRHICTADRISRANCAAMCRHGQAVVPAMLNEMHHRWADTRWQFAKSGYDVDLDEWHEYHQYRLG